MTKSTNKEVRGLFDRGTFKFIRKEDIPDDAKVLTGGFILAIKSTEDGTIKYNARFVMGGHRDKHKNVMVHNSSTQQPQSVRLLLALTQSYKSEVCTVDVTQTYWQSTDPLLREIQAKQRVPEF